MKEDSMSERMRSGALWVAVVALSVVAVHAFGATGYAYSPRENVLRIWEPYHKWNLPRTPGNRIIDAITEAHTQGYTLVRYPDPVRDNHWGRCSPTDFVGFANETGVGFVFSHGHKGFFVAATAGTDKKNKQPALNWVAQLADKRHVKVKWDKKRKVQAVLVYNKWLRRNWYSTFNRNRSIVVIQSCYSAAGLKSVVKSCGGRIGFGYPDLCYSSHGAENNRLLFGRMNGTLENALLRGAGDAYKKGGFADNFRKWGDDDTTLCPSVYNPWHMDYKPQARPVADGAGLSGTGVIFFDTY